MKEFMLAAIVNLFGAPPTTAGDLTETLNKIQTLFTQIIIPIIMWGLSLLFLILGIRAGASIASAGTPEEKKKAIDKLIWLIIGIVVTFILGFAIDPLVSYLSGLFSKT